MKLLICLKAFSGYGRCMFMEIVLKEIELTKEIFVLDIVNKFDVAIPFRLLQDYLPMSCRFYDPVIKIAQQLTSEETLREHRYKFDLNIKRVTDDRNLGKKLIDMIGMSRIVNKQKPKGHVYVYPTIQS